MQYKIFLVVIIILKFTSCQKYENSLLEIEKIEISSDEKKEILIQKKILINEMAEASKKLHQISWPILVKNKKKCVKNTSKSYGIIFAHVDDLPKEDSEIFMQMYNKNINAKYFRAFKVSSFPIVLSVAINSPADNAGLKENDVVLQIDNNKTKDFRKKLFENLQNSSNVVLTLLRDNKVIKKNIIGVNACVYNVQPIPSVAPNAFADGNKVFITMAAIKLARTDDEIAFLVGHEIAHNIFHYKAFNASESGYMGINYLDKPKVREAKNLFIWTNEKKEIEADIEGTKLAFKAGYSLENVNDYWRRLSVFNPELISKSINIYKSNAYRAALINKTLRSLKENINEKAE